MKGGRQCLILVLKSLVLKLLAVKVISANILLTIFQSHLLIR